MTAMPNSIRTHVYIPDRWLGPDHRGDYPCQTCGLPQNNRRHQHTAPSDDLSARITGENREVVA